MKRFKLDPQKAFDQLIAGKKGGEQGAEDGSADIEDGFGQGAVVRDRPRWIKNIRATFFVSLAAMLVVGLGAFYWFITNDAQPEHLSEPIKSPALAVIGEKEAKQMIAVNLKEFLSSENNEDRLRYVYLPDEEKESMAIYYDERRLRDTPLWKIDRIEPVVTGDSELWFVVFTDVKKNKHVVSFQRYDDDYRLHWSAMKAFGEITWEELILNRPEEPVKMRAYIRRYEGVSPLWASDQSQCFIVEDRRGLFSEIGIMAESATGYQVLKNLSSGRHAVTLELAYQITPRSGERKVFMITSLSHLRWQKLSGDDRFSIIREGRSGSN